MTVTAHLVNSIHTLTVHQDLQTGGSNTNIRRVSEEGPH